MIVTVPYGVDFYWAVRVQVLGGASTADSNGCQVVMGIGTLPLP